MPAAVDRPDPGRLLTVDEVAGLLRLHAQTVYQMIARGSLPGVVRIGRVIRIHREKLLAGLSEKGEGASLVHPGRQADRLHRQKLGRRGPR